MPDLKRDYQFSELPFRLSEKEHKYGANVHILSDPFLLTILAKLCSPQTVQPLVNEYIRQIYTSMVLTVANRELPHAMASIPTRMQEFHPEGVYHGQLIDPDTCVVTVNLARAGTYPSHVCYEQLNYLLPPENIRQDHISISRQTSQAGEVTGSEMAGHKIGGKIDESFVLLPDPMGATGGTVARTLELYKTQGQARKYLLMHCIVTPEYIKKIQATHPDVEIYAIRLDRGLSDAKVLKTIPGTNWDQEKGLNEQSYIVPGGGGLGEVLNNSFV